jgi:hemolysin III
VSHHIAFYVALLAGGALVVLSSDLQTRIAMTIYASGLAGMFGVSATLHRRDWAPRAYGWLRRADHAMIFVCIGGTYTPFCMLALGLDSENGLRLLVLAWSATGLGVLRAMIWPHAPRAVTAVLFVIVGWVAVGYVGDIYAALDPVSFGLLAGGGVCLTIGAVVYLLRRPDPWPETFGYHEVFHLIIILGCASIFVAVARVAF